MLGPPRDPEAVEAAAGPLHGPDLMMHDAKPKAIKVWNWLKRVLQPCFYFTLAHICGLN